MQDVTSSASRSPDAHPGPPPAPNPLLDMVAGATLAPFVYVAIELDIPDLLAEHACSMDELAAATKTPVDTLTRLMRALAALDVVRETPDGLLELTPLGATLRRDAPGLVRSMYRLTVEESTWRALGDAAASIRTGQPAIDRLYGKSIFEVWRDDPHARDMQEALFRQRTTAVAGAFVAAYDFAQFSCVADIGGNTGALLAPILRAHPQVRGILFDLPHVVERAEHWLAEAGVLDRCTIVSGDFFESVPTGADAYVLQTIIHDWGDAQAATILRSCRAAMGATGVLLLLETVLSPRLESGPLARFGATTDLLMLVLNRGGRERTADEYRALVSEAGLHMTRIVPTATPTSIIEARPA